MYPTSASSNGAAARGRSAAPVAVPAGAAAIIQLTDEPITETLSRSSTSARPRVVTVIEALSPANKRPGDGQDQYLKKQGELLREGEPVEIDLLLCRQVRSVRRSARSSTVAPHTIGSVRARLVSRAGGGLRVRCASLCRPSAFHFEKLTPTCASTWPLEQCYHNGGYVEDLDYEAELTRR
jgi:hypothetical protein